jgi:hypothetical protein
MVRLRVVLRELVTGLAPKRMWCFLLNLQSANPEKVE